MRKQDVEAVGEVAGEVLWAGGSLAKGIHEEIARRPFRALGPAAAPWRMLHDGIARAVYAGVRHGLRGSARGAAALVATGAGGDDAPLASSPVGSVVLGALNGLYGNHLDERGNALALGMEIRCDGARVAPTPPALVAAFPDATSRIVVFVHGLCETEAAWRLAPRREQTRDGRTYGERLQDELSLTPVYVRYNSGLHVSENGRRLAALLDGLVSSWPTGVEEITLVGHSMGGLVARSACHYGEDGGHHWTNEIRHVFCLGTPHLGADLEKGANLLAWGMARVPETRAIAGLLNARSAGIKDLRFGSCVEEDWRDCDADEFLRDRCQEALFLPEANYYFVAASLIRGPLGMLLGDLLVRVPSASGRRSGSGRRVPFHVENGHELQGLTHFDLLNHPAVYAQLRKWITGRSAPGLSE